MGKSIGDLFPPFSRSLTHSPGLCLAASLDMATTPCSKPRGWSMPREGVAQCGVYALGPGALEPVGNPGAAQSPWSGGSRGSLALGAAAGGGAGGTATPELACSLVFPPPCPSSRHLGHSLLTAPDKACHLLRGSRRG